MTDSPRVATPELRTLAKIDKLLCDLTAEERGRCLAWLTDRHKEAPPPDRGNPGGQH